jgi:hypothetical protein
LYNRKCGECIYWRLSDRCCCPIEVCRVMATAVHRESLFTNQVMIYFWTRNELDVFIKLYTARLTEVTHYW